MAVIRLGGFQAELPLLHPRYLPEGNAQVAKNCRLNTGALRPLREPDIGQQIYDGVDSNWAFTIRALFKDNAPTGGNWLVSEYPTSFASALITDDDVYGRTIVTKDQNDDSYAPKIVESKGYLPGGGAVLDINTTSFTNYDYNLDVPAPTTTPTATLVGTATDPSSTPETRRYVYTYIFRGTEGPPSFPSDEVEWREGQTVNVANLGDNTDVKHYNDPTTTSDYQNLTTKGWSKRIYRTNTSATGSTQYQLVREVQPDDVFPIELNLVDIPGILDEVEPQDLGEVLSTTTYDPPHYNMKGIVAHPNNFLLGFYDRTIYMSEPGIPHAWPLEYRLATQADIVGLGVYNNIVLVTTKKAPYLVVGSDPAAMSLIELELYQSCTSLRGIVDFGSGIAYPSPDGLMFVTPSGPVLSTANVIERDEWQALTPTSFHAYLWEGEYLCFYDNGTTQGGFAFSPLQPGAGIRFFDYYYTAGYYDAEADQLHLIEPYVNGTPNHRVIWDAGTTNAEYTWKSKELRLENAENFSVGKVIADTYPVTMEIYADGVLRHTRVVTDDKAFRLPGGFKAQKYEVQLKGTGEVLEVLMATSMQEISRVA